MFAGALGRPTARDCVYWRTGHEQRSHKQARLSVAACEDQY